MENAYSRKNQGKRSTIPTVEQLIDLHEEAMKSVDVSHMFENFQEEPYNFEFDLPGTMHDYFYIKAEIMH